MNTQRTAMNVWLFMSCQALTMSIPAMVIFVGSIIGRELAPSPNLATMPVALFMAGSALSTMPIILLMQRFGRKPVFLVCALLAAGACGLAMWALALGDFTLYLAAIAMLGIGLGAGQQYRFAAMESVAAERMPEAASRVLIGGIVAAFLGPELAVRGEHLFAVAYQGAFALLMVVALGAFVLLLFIREPVLADQSHNRPGRPLLALFRQPVLIAALMSGCAGFGIMSLVMTATPLHMHVHQGHDLVATKWVIQSHIVAMFLPSFITPWIIARIRVAGLIWLGGLCMALVIVVVFANFTFAHYWVALVLLGLGWNFLFIGGTALLPQGYREEERFKVQASNDLTIFSVQAVGALAAGWVLSSWGWQALLLIGVPILMMLVAALANWSWRQR